MTCDGANNRRGTGSGAGENTHVGRRRQSLENPKRRGRRSLRKKKRKKRSRGEKRLIRGFVRDGRQGEGGEMRGDPRPNTSDTSCSQEDSSQHRKLKPYRTCLRPRECTHRLSAAVGQQRHGCVEGRKTHGSRCSEEKTVSRNSGHVIPLARL